jgi:capsular exopolysaccharide synthesis family protein
VDPIDYLKTLRRRWLVVAVSVLVSMAISSIALLSLDGSAASQGSSYRATTILLTGESTLTDPRINALSTLAALVTIGEVPKRVAEALDFEGEPSALASTVSASIDADTRLMRISATASDPARAEVVADTFAKELISYIEARNGRIVEEEAREFRRRMRRLQREIEALDQLIASAPLTEAEDLKAQRDTKALEAQNAVLTFQQSGVLSPAGGGLEIIQPAIAGPMVPASGGEDLQVTTTPQIRLLIGAVLGLLAGVGIALFLDRFDRRIRTKEVAERSFQAPVLAEIPRVPKAARSALLQLTAPKSLATEAFRLLGMSLASGLPGTVQRPSGNGSEEGARTILVTSPGPDEGKSTVVANVAASLAELGKKVLIISCDFRAPDVHRLFGIQDGEGLGKALLSPNGGPVLAGYIHGTAVKGVFLVPSGARSERPVELLTSENMRKALQEARRSADIVLLDTPPILMVSDAANLISEADAVLLVARARKTTTDTAKRTRELLRRLRVPAVGVALNATTEGPPGYGSTRWSRFRGFPSLARH